LKNYSKVYNKSHILIEKCHVALFYQLISKFLNQNYLEVFNYFQEKSENEEILKMKESLEYIQPISFVSDTVIKHEEQLKKKPAQYLKYKTIPKWHYHALDLLR